MHTLCLVKRWEHHTASGGYDHLARTLGADEVARGNLRGLTARMARKIWQRRTQTGKYLVDYRFEDWLAEQKVLLRSLTNRPDLVHVLYGDEQLDLLLRRRKLLRCPLVSTFHLPAERVRERFERFHKREVNGIDAAIVLARSELSAFENWFGQDKVVYIPHGIDTDTFRPADARSVKKRLNILIVGDHMRDWEVIHKVIDKSHLLGLDIEFEVVTKPEFFAHFTGCAGVKLHPRLAEGNLIARYQSADALLVPVTQATANNSILEALACGTPVISTNIGGIPDYVSPGCGWLTPRGSVTPILELLHELNSKREIAHLLRQNCRAHALKFDWRRVGQGVTAVYEALLAGKQPSAATPDLALFP
jgi:glycosyltransferase involved in cell wall biosynthesis